MSSGPVRVRQAPYYAPGRHLVLKPFASLSESPGRPTAAQINSTSYELAFFNLVRVFFTAVSSAATSVARPPWLMSARV